LSIIDIRECETGSIIEADVCIIGSGPAGLVLANELKDTKLSIAIFESGGFEFDRDSQSLASGQSVGVPYLPLSSTRMRLFGGTSNHWGGNVRMLDPHDFEERPWIPNSGWPLRFTEINPYNDRARAYCGFPATAFDNSYWAEQKRNAGWQFIDDAIESDVFHTIGGNRRNFGDSYRKTMEDSPNVRVYLNAIVKEIASADAGTSISRLSIVTLDGKSFEAKARTYVLATGGIENARLLLLSNRNQENGLGNDHDLVGRYFMEHLTVPMFCEFFPADSRVNVDFYRSYPQEWGDVWGVLNLAESLQRTEQTGNCRFQIGAETNAFNQNMSAEGMRSLLEASGHLRQGNIPKELQRHLANIIADIDDIAGAGYNRLVHHPNYPIFSLKVIAIGEQMPNPYSRVFLGETLDSIGQRQIVLDWQITDQDNENIRKYAHILARQFGRSQLGRIREKFPNEVFNEVAPRPHIHHMGTTRMHESPTKGVVDADCMVHGIQNLFVAGSSVFPTVGNVNPTYTIIALSIRLADHLKLRLT